VAVQASLAEPVHRRTASGNRAGHKQTYINAIAFLQMLENPVCGLLRKAALPRTADDDGDSRHGSNPHGFA
jgi:hypothetical protein